MRGGARRTRTELVLALRAFGWDRAVIAAARHSTLPWFESFALELTLDAVPLTAHPDLGDRDRLSLVAQFAAHQAFLQFAGIPDGECDPEEWAVVQRRGADCRLVRVAARGDAGDGPPVLTTIQQFAELVGAPRLEVLKQSWARAESVYQEIDARLRADATADLRWMRRAACGELAPPGTESLRTLLGATRGRFGFSDPATIATVRNAATLAGAPRVVTLGGGSPLQRYSALHELVPLDARPESEVAEQLLAMLATQRILFAVPELDTFDAASRHVMQMLAAAENAVWLVPGRDLPDARFFLLSTRLEARRALEGRFDRAMLEQFVASRHYAAYLDDGELPPDEVSTSLGSVGEPARSYLAALALLGTRIPRALATQFLERLLFNGDLASLAIDGIADAGDEFAFASDAVRELAMQAIPKASRAALCRVAAELANDPALWIECGEPQRAIEIFERGDHDPLRVLRILPRQALATSPTLAGRVAAALIDRGRYRDAREIALLLPEIERERMLARIERRTGDYAPALARLERVGGEDLLRGELLYLDARYDEARAAFDRCAPSLALAYHRAVLANEIGQPVDDSWMTPRGYLAARFDTYRADDPEEAARFAAESLQRATTVIERIDAALDLAFATFTAGRWDDARRVAMDALALVEETQGDRAAGGLVFTLAYLAADDGQWAHASQRITRLRHFYAATNDERRLRELDLLAAHLDFSRARFDDARRAAAAVLRDSTLHDQIREAAALILDEIDRIEHIDAPLRSTGRTRNRELTRRHEALAHPQLIEKPATRAEMLKNFRAALMLDRHDVVRSLADELGITLETSRDGASVELRVLRIATKRPFPFDAADFGPLPWRFAVRNRLGQWHELGSREPLDGAELDRIAASGARDWIACSERELLFIDGLDSWSDDSREAIASLFRIRAEHHRLQRVVEQDEASRAPSQASSVDGIVGESPAIAEVFRLITRVAKRDVAVCILGESGTGKELVARAIHRHSPRRGKTFTPVNCAALPENLIESELFGHVRGAFTGADRDRPGLIETTDGGTLFLDEIGEMPLAAQSKLLRFLQEGELRRVGDTASRTADVRIVTATNRKLETAVEEGRFREDLYYRIRGIEVALPPLRERGNDVLLLAKHFLAREAEKHRGGATRLSPDVESLFTTYAWPGNVRELQNAIRAAHAIAGDAPRIELEHLPERMRRTGGTRAANGSYQDAVAKFRRELIERSLASTNGNQNQAATSLGMSRQALAYQIRELGILVKR